MVQICWFRGRLLVQMLHFHPGSCWSAACFAVSKRRIGKMCLLFWCHWWSPPSMKEQTTTPYRAKLETASIETLFLWASLNRTQPRRRGVNATGVLTQLAINGWGSAVHGNGSYNCTFFGLCWHLCSSTALCMQRNHWTALLAVGVFSLTLYRQCGVPF